MLEIIKQIRRRRILLDRYPVTERESASLKSQMG